MSHGVRLAGWPTVGTSLELADQALQEVYTVTDDQLIPPPGSTFDRCLEELLFQQYGLSVSPTSSKRVYDNSDCSSAAYGVHMCRQSLNLTDLSRMVLQVLRHVDVTRDEQTLRPSSEKHSLFVALCTLLRVPAANRAELLSRVAI